jgi:hypothetical protein
MLCILAGDAPCVKTRKVTSDGHRWLSRGTACRAPTERRSPVLQCKPNTGPSSLVNAGCIALCFASMLDRRGRPKLRKIVRKFAAVAALAALLLPGFSALAETLSASDLPACCNTAYCPVHHRQGRNLQKDKGICDAMGIPGQNNCSMRACDAPPSSVVGTSAFVMPAPVALRGPSSTKATLAVARQFFPNVASIPLIPPPRTLPS